MNPIKVVSPAEWLHLRKALLEKEKEFTRLRDELSKQRRLLPWVKIEKSYRFEGTQGTKTLAELFEKKSQLIIYHFMFGEEWDEGCPSCSFWADNYNGITVHLKQRDANFVAISYAPLDKLIQYRKRMGWEFEWVSSNDSEFNFDFQASFSSSDMDKKSVYYNYKNTQFPASEAPGVSVFCKDENGNIYHTYSCYSRGIDILNTAYHYMDLLPKGRDEDNLPWAMEWLQRHDQY